MRDLLINPIWRGEDLGLPLPESPHAVSVALPRWADVIGYEEKRPETVARMRSGYPRFLVHPRVMDLARALAADATEPCACLPFPSRRVATRAAAYVTRRAGVPARVVVRDTLAGVVTTPAGETALRAFWQHTGQIVSSRQAEAWLEGRSADLARGHALRSALRTQLAGYYDCAPEDVFLTPTGMAAIDAAHAAVTGLRPGLPTAQLGFPYVDTLKLQEQFGSGAVFVPYHEGTAAARLIERLQRQPLAACFCEIPGNPLLECPDIAGLLPWLRAQGIPLVVDDVVSTPLNIDLSPVADVVVTSLTKYFAGTGDVMGGAIILNPRSVHHYALRETLRAAHEALLWEDDAEVLDRQARGFPERMRRHNAGGLYLAERLRAHPAVAQVWYPKWQSGEHYETVRRPDGGWSNLISFLTVDPARTAPRVYDALEICKGPTLGTVFTLACPFALLAHYGELDWAESCGVSRHLIRVSVGIEDPETLWPRFARALDAVVS